MNAALLQLCGLYDLEGGDSFKGLILSKTQFKTALY